MNLTTDKNIAFEYIKFVLIMGVVAIHSNVYVDYDVATNPVGFYIVDFFAAKFTMVCVPCFFILSGYLYFKNIEKFSWETYRSKTKSRISTLLIPYLIWNILDLALCILKYKFLGYPSYGVIDDDGISITRLLEGFWDHNNTYPYAFAFWFIRNLIVFVVISPIAYLLGGVSKYILCGFLAVVCAFDVNLWGFEYFIIGCGIASFFKHQFFNIKKSVALWALIAWCGIAATDLWVDFGRFGHFLKMVCTFGTFVSLFYFCKHIKISSKNKVVGAVISSTFLIYAVHQFFCTLTREFYIDIFGVDSAIGGVISFLLSLLTMVIISLGVGLIMRKFMPGVTKIMSGGR